MQPTCKCAKETRICKRKNLNHSQFRQISIFKDLNVSQIRICDIFVTYQLRYMTTPLPSVFVYGNGNGFCDGKVMVMVMQRNDNGNVTKTPLKRKNHCKLKIIILIDLIRFLLDRLFKFSSQIQIKILTMFEWMFKIKVWGMRNFRTTII